MILPSKHRPYFRSLRSLGIMIASYFFIAAILSLTANPWRINNTPLSIDALDSSREISNTVVLAMSAENITEIVHAGNYLLEVDRISAHESYCTSQPDDVAWWRSLIKMS